MKELLLILITLLKQQAFLVVDGLGQNVTSKFFLSQDLTAGSDKYKYQIKSMASSLGNDALGNAAGADAYFVYENNSSVRDVYTFTLGTKGYCS